MATVHIASPVNGKYPPEGTILPGEPFERPYVTLNDGKVMTFAEWSAKGNPA